MVSNLLKSSFRPEFLNRIDEIVFYKPLTKENIYGIVDLLAESLRSRLSDKQLGLRITEEAKDYIIDEGFDPVYGARPLKRYLQSTVETMVAKCIVADNPSPGSVIVIERNQEGLSSHIE